MFRLACRLSVGFAAVLLGSIANAQSVVTVKDLNPFTHVALIPGGADLTSIRFERVKLVRIPTRIRSTSTSSCDEAAFQEPGGSLFCPFSLLEAPAPAYELNYSYTGQPLASDEYGARHFTFTVYYRPEELSPAMRETISRSKGRHGDVQGFFEATTTGIPERRVAIDEANSKFCQGNHVDGSWTQANPRCRDDVQYKNVMGVADYVAVRVDPAAPRLTSR
jgi:hypothetical protein